MQQNATILDFKTGNRISQEFLRLSQFKEDRLRDQLGRRFPTTLWKPISQLSKRFPDCPVKALTFSGGVKVNNNSIEVCTYEGWKEVTAEDRPNNVPQFNRPISPTELKSLNYFPKKYSTIILGNLSRDCFIWSDKKYKSSQYVLDTILERELYFIKSGDISRGLDLIINTRSDLIAADSYIKQLKKLNSLGVSIIVNFLDMHYTSDKERKIARPHDPSMLRCKKSGEKLKQCLKKIEINYIGE